MYNEQLNKHVFFCCTTKQNVLFIDRWHNENLNIQMPVDFQSLKLKVIQKTLTGEEKYVSVFTADTPSDIKGAKPKIEVASLLNKYILVI